MTYRVFSEHNTNWLPSQLDSDRRRDGRDGARGIARVVPRLREGGRRHFGSLTRWGRGTQACACAEVADVISVRRRILVRIDQHSRNVHYSMCTAVLP